MSSTTDFLVLFSLSLETYILFVLCVIGGYSKYPIICGCGKFIKNRYVSCYHHKTCRIVKDKTHEDVEREIMYDMANVRLSKLESEFKSIWVSRYGSLTHCAIK